MFNCKPIQLNRRTIVLVSTFEKETGDNDHLLLCDDEEYNKHYDEINKEAAQNLLNSLNENYCDEFLAELSLKCLELISKGTSKGRLNNKDVPYIECVLNDIKNKFK